MDAKLKAQYAEIIKSKNIILLTVAGSGLLGLESGDKSDRDEIGIYIEDMREIAGFGTEQHVTWRSAEARTGKQNEPSKPGDVDLMLYGLRKFLRLALGGNPTVINVLYAPENACGIMTDLGKQLQALASDIVSKRAGHAFLGYLNQQRLRLIGNNQFGSQDCAFDTKYAMHMLRLGLQGIELLSKGKLHIPMELHKDFLIAVKNGEFSFSNCVNQAESYEQVIRNLMDSQLEIWDSPNFGKVEEWMLGVYKNFWGKQ